MQDAIAAEMKNVSIIETADLIIVNEDGSINGTDQCHFNYKDMEILGIRFGKKLLEISK